MDSPEVAAHLAAVATELLAEPTEQLTVRSIVKRAVEVVPDAESVSLAVRVRHQKLQTLAATDELAMAADELQFALGEGPCLDSVEQADWVRSGSVGQDPRWPVWGPRAAELGVGSLLTVQAYAGSEPRCALNMYSRTEGGFADRDDVELALLYATHAANALAAARLVEGLETAVGSRHVIGLAQGIVMERYGLTVDQSFAFLRRLSSTTNTKLVEVARSIVKTREIPAEPPSSDHTSRHLIDS
jgi:hypothetical protein